jgi:hypothetical protein
MNGPWHPSLPWLGLHNIGTEWSIIYFPKQEGPSAIWHFRARNLQNVQCTEKETRKKNEGRDGARK